MVSDIPILASRTEWFCPNCDQVDVTVESRPHTRFHACGRMGGLTAPLLPAGTKCKVVAHEREDYINGQIVTVDANGRPVATIETVRDDGNDVIAFAGCANINILGG